MLLLLTLSALSLFLALLNFFTIRTVKNKANLINQKVSILIPMRNEIDNAEDCIASVLAQQGLTNFEVIVLDDASTDGTN
jgi:cellulose synthase/poly-beta-1,6-N-acetylglucosamine synthase-like glycosyltransferase